MTFERLLERTLAGVSGEMDRRQGSVIYDALAPACAELAQIYIELDNVLRMSFAQTADGEWLDRRAAEMGIFRREATPAVRLGLMWGEGGEPFDVEIGSRFNAGMMSFVVVARLSEGRFRLESETPGDAGNKVLGSIVPIENVNGLVRAEITEILVHGEDPERDESLLNRYRNAVVNRVQDGNVAQYKLWAETFNGIGPFKVFPLRYGLNTVRVSICDVYGMPASEVLVEEFQTYLDPVSEGLGNGVAPIGAKVTVGTGNVANIDVGVEVSISSEFDLEIAEKNIENAIKGFLASIVYRRSRVGYLQLASVIDQVDGVNALLRLSLNNGAEDILLDVEDVPILNGLEVVVNG